jgi:hypothetical protein
MLVDAPDAFLFRRRIADRAFYPRRQVEDPLRVTPYQGDHGGGECGLEDESV